MRRAPLLLPALGMALGIGVAARWQPSLVVVAILVALAALLLGASLLPRKPHPTATALAVALLCATLGSGLFTLQSAHDWGQLIPDKAILRVRLTSTPQSTPRTLRAEATAVQLLPADGSAPTPLRGTMRLYFRQDSAAYALRFGDELIVHGYPDRQRRTLYLTAPHYSVVAHDSTSLRARSERLRLLLLQRMQRGPLAYPSAAMAEALALGHRAHLDPAQVAAFRDAGFAHVLAVSGLHVGLLAAWIGWLFFPFGSRRGVRRVRCVVQLMAVWGFALLTGMSASTLRAALMFSLFIVSDLTARHTPRLNLLAATALLTLVANPSVLFDVGWQLSYCAVGALLLVQPLNEGRQHRLLSHAISSTAATLGTLPICLASFGRLPLYFLVANLLLLPLAEVLLGLSLLYLLLPVALTAWPVDLLAKAIHGVCSAVASWPGAVVECAPISDATLLLIAVATWTLLAAPQVVMPRLRQHDSTPRLSRP